MSTPPQVAAAPEDATETPAAGSDGGVTAETNQDRAAGEVGLVRDLEVSVDGVARIYDVYVPASHWQAAVPSPVVVLLHGQRSSRSDLEGGTRRPAPYQEWQTVADDSNVLLVVPQGIEGENGHTGWNDCRGDVVGNPTADDVAFITAALGEVSGNYLVDADQIFAVGTSNGGHMAIRLAHESPTPLAGIAVIAAGMPAANECTPPAAPVSALFMWGTNDPLAPYVGGAMAGERGEILSADASVAYWTDHNNTTTSPTVTTFPDVDSDDDSTVDQFLYDNGDDNSRVALYRITGGGHTEPSISQQYSRLFKRVVGEQNNDIEMAAEVWQFFQN